MANATDRLNQLQQYMDYYQKNNTHGGFGNGNGSFSYGANGLPATIADWANTQLKDQESQQQFQDQNAAFSGMYGGGGGQSNFGQPPAYVHPQMPQQDNPYSQRATQLNNDPYGGSGGGGASNSLAQMFKGGKYRAGG